MTSSDQPSASYRSEIPLRLCGDRVLIRADVESQAPEVRPSGVFAAKTLSAAVVGTDPQRSWFVGTVVALGPDAQRFDVRPYVMRRLRDLIEDERSFIIEQELAHLVEDIAALPSVAVDAPEIGDRVTFSWQSGQEIVIEDDRYIILHAHEILGIFERVAA